MKVSRRILEPPALELLEEAVHLLRRAPAVTLAAYYLGTVPFVLALLFFWAHTTWFRPTTDQVAWEALGLVGLFALMKGLQAEFCTRLMAQRLGAPAPVWLWRRTSRVIRAQMRLQSWTLPALWLAALVTLPVGWVYAYAQNLSVLADNEGAHADAVEQAKLWPAQNHVALLVISCLALVVWVNLGAAFITIPWLANRLLGIDNIFGFSGLWYLNTTFLASVTALTWLAVDPLVKAFYVLRVFHGRARRTGDDLRVELQIVQHAPAIAARIVAVALALGAFQPVSVTAAAEPAPRAMPPAVEPGQLDRAIDQVLMGAEFRWRLPPPAAAEAKTDESVIARFLREGVEMAKETLRGIGRAIKRFVEWIERALFKEERSVEKPATAGGGTLFKVVLYVFIAAAVLLILWVIWLIVRSTRTQAANVLAVRAVTPAQPDLRDENVEAGQLPTDGWLALAREQAQRGEWRLALRALYLAMLARYADEGLVSLAKFKTNLDYEREVRRRALARAELVARFAARRREFESVWYGCAATDETHVRAWLADLERRTAA